MGEMAAASILHVDLDAFYASVEVRDRPELAGLPVAVGAGVVLSATYEARTHGVTSAMPIGKARRLCPDLRVIDSSFSDYVDESRRVFTILERFTPEVEPVSIDEAFMDVSGSRSSPSELGAGLRTAVRQECGLPISVGIATTKFLAKVASRRAKPNGMVVVAAGEELDFLHPLSVDHLWGVGPATLQRLRRYGIETVGDLGEVPRQALSSWVGGAVGAHLHSLAWNRDPRRVARGGRRRSLGSQSAIGRGAHTRSGLRRTLLAIADRVTARMRDKEIEGRTLILRLRYRGMDRATRSHTFAAPTAATTIVYRAAAELLDGVFSQTPPDQLTLLGLTMTDLRKCGPAQLSLGIGAADTYPHPGSPQGLAVRDVDTAVDGARNRFGRDAVTRARLQSEGERKNTAS